MKSEATIESVRNDKTALPPNKSADDKYYIGFYQSGELVAIMDLIMKYPNKETVYIGLFMLDKAHQGNGVGTEIIREALACFKRMGFIYAKLGYISDNTPARRFWKKNGFKETGETVKTKNYNIIPAVCELEKSLTAIQSGFFL